MIRISCRDYQTFFATFATLRHSGVDAVAAGANELTVPDGTDPTLLRAVAGGGVTVHAFLPEPAPVRTAEPSQPPAKATAKRSTRKTRTDGE
jgi:hypothetical protein